MYGGHDYAGIEGAGPRTCTICGLSELCTAYRRSPSAEQHAGDGRRRAEAGRRGRVAAGQPALVGRRRRRLPGRARRLPRRRRLRLVPGGAARGATRGCSATCEGARVLEVGAGAAPVRALAGRRRARGPSALDLSRRHAAPRRARWTRAPASPCRSCRPTPSRCRSGDGIVRPGLLGLRRRAVRGRLGRVMREVARVLRPGGRWVFSVTHPMRWAFPDDPGPGGLTVAAVVLRPHAVRRGRRRTAPPTYVEHHRTLGDRVRELVAAGLVLVDLVEPEWPEGQRAGLGPVVSPLRGGLIPGTAIFCCRKP